MVCLSEDNSPFVKSTAKIVNRTEEVNPATKHGLWVSLGLRIRDDTVERGVLYCLCTETHCALSKTGAVSTGGPEMVCITHDVTTPVSVFTIDRKYSNARWYAPGNINNPKTLPADLPTASQVSAVQRPQQSVPFPAGSPPPAPPNPLLSVDLKSYLPILILAQRHCFLILHHPGNYAKRRCCCYGFYAVPLNLDARYPPPYCRQENSPRPCSLSSPFNSEGHGASGRVPW